MVGAFFIWSKERKISLYDIALKWYYFNDDIIHKN